MKSKAIIVSGYFNPLHKGHLELFQKAKAFGDQLWAIVDKAPISIDKDETKCATLAHLAEKYSSEYELYFANGGDQNNESIPEVLVSKEKGIGLLEGLGDKIQSSSWLLKK